MPAPSIVWSDERVAELRRLWESGLTSSQIADRFGVSRNTVMGKVSRLGLNARRNPVEPVAVLFERFVDIVADHDVSFTEAASRVPMHHSTAIRLWNDMVRAGGRQYA